MYFPNFAGAWFFPKKSSLGGVSCDDIPTNPKQEKVSVGNAEGYNCSVCIEFYPMAELNQPDGKDFYYFTCFSCRKGLKTIFEKDKV